jgi:hypothetical protein
MQVGHRLKDPYLSKNKAGHFSLHVGSFLVSYPSCFDTNTSNMKNSVILFYVFCILSSARLLEAKEHTKTKVFGAVKVPRDSLNILSIDTVRVAIIEDSSSLDENSVTLRYQLLITTFLGLITILLTYFGYKINQRSSLLQKNQWHSQLFKEFYIQDTYKEMRYILDFKPNLEYCQLISSLEPESADRISEKLYDYLNFFEFIASMWKSKQIDYHEIMNLFRYYLVMLSKIDFIRNEIKSKDFDFLESLLLEIEKREKS